MPEILIVSILGGVLVLLIFIVTLIAMRYRRTQPNQALVVYGMKPGKKESEVHKKPYKIVMGGGVFVWPILEQARPISLELMEVRFNVRGVLSRVGVPVNFEGVAQIKIKADEESVGRASELLLGKTENESNHIMLSILEGHIRSVIGAVEPEYIYLNLKEFTDMIIDSAAADLEKIGFYMVSISAEKISDENGYYDIMGKSRLAEAKKSAVDGESKAKIKRYELEKVLAEANKDYEIRISEYGKIINESKAEAEMAYDLAKYKQEQLVVAEQIRTKVIEKEGEVKLEQLEGSRKAEELETSVKKQTDAERYRIERLALAEEAQMSSRAKAESAMKKEIGTAEAEVIRLKGSAEASAMKEKAEAWKMYNEAAILEMIVDKLPAIVHELSSPLSKTEKIVINSGGAAGENGGVSRVTNDMIDVVKQVPTLLEAISGLEIKDLVSRSRKQNESTK